MNKYAETHVPYSRAKGKKPRAEIKEMPVHAGHPKRTTTAKTVKEPTEIGLMKQRIKNAKVSALRANRHAAGRHLSSDAGIKQMKRELLALTKKRRK